MEQNKVENFTKEELKDFFIGVFVIGCALLACAIFKLQRNVWKDAEDTDYAVYATFNRTDGLVIGDKVRMGGIDIGLVTDSVLDNNFRATLTLKIRKDIKIPDDSNASIVSSGIMGNKYIEISPGGSEDFMAENDEFGFTQDAMVLEELVERIISLGQAKRTPKPQEEK
jgi:phospholipid/cholesterol/gamma-HCH transport system substrate-binding protein